MSSERKVIGAVLINPRSIADAVDLQPEHFVDPRCAALWSAAQRLWFGGKHLDADTLVKEARIKGLDAGHVAEMAIGAPAAAMAFHAREVIEASVDRQARHIIDAALKSDARGSELVGLALSRLGDLSRPASSRGISAKALAAQVYEYAEQQALKAKSGVVLFGVPSGVPEIDAVTGGFPRRVLTIVGARPSVGKTSLLVGSAIAAAERGEVCDFYSLEDDALALGVRSFASLGGMPAWRIRRGTLREPSDTQAMLSAANQFQALNIDYQDIAPQSATALALEMKGRALARKTTAIYVDYIQLLDEKDRNASRNERLAAISRLFKIVAKETGAAVIVASQLRRSESEQPSLQDLRESGSLEQDAHVVLLLWRPDLSLQNFTLVVCDVAKNKEGKTQSIDLAYEGEQMRFRSMLPSEKHAASLAREGAKKVRRIFNA